MIGCLRTRVRKQPIIELYFESETVLKFYNLEAWFDTVNLNWFIVLNKGTLVRVSKSLCENCFQLTACELYLQLYSSNHVTLTALTNCRFNNMYALFCSISTGILLFAKVHI